jgi:CubicO group peptidase (beta-lactamase class C family)
LVQTWSYDPGTVFVYDNASTFLASAMVTRVTGQTVRDFLVERLFGKPGIPAPVWTESDDRFTRSARGVEFSTESLEIFGQFLL